MNDDINLGREDLQTLIIFAYKYSMPRFGTSAFTDVERLIVNNIDSIDTYVLKDFRNELEYYFNLWDINPYKEDKDEKVISPRCRRQFYFKIVTELEKRLRQE